MNKLILGRLANNQGGDNLRDMVVKINSNQDETLEIIEDTKNELEESVDDLDAKFTDKTNELEEGKVDKVSGKGLSSNDYTNSDKELLQTLASKVSSLETRVAALESQP
jgi:polyhydroxyalkanoate synthesis regulator phasin